MTKGFDELVEFFSKDKFATNNGMHIVSVTEGDASCALNITSEHLNAVGGVQGGAVFTLADFAFAVATNCGERKVVSVKADISFMRATRGKKLIAHAVEKSSTRKLVFYDVEIRDDLDELIAAVSMTGYIKQ